MDDLYQGLIEGHNKPEDIAFRKIERALGSEIVLEAVANAFKVARESFLVRKYNSPLRGVAAHFLVKYAFKNQREIGKYVCIGNGASVSKQISGCLNQLPEDRALRRLFTKIEKRLTALKEERREAK